MFRSNENSKEQLTEQLIAIREEQHLKHIMQQIKDLGLAVAFLKLNLEDFKNNYYSYFANEKRLIKINAIRDQLKELQQDIDATSSNWHQLKSQLTLKENYSAYLKTLLNKLITASELLNKVENAVEAKPSFELYVNSLNSCIEQLNRFANQHVRWINDLQTTSNISTEMSTSSVEKEHAENSTDTEPLFNENQIQPEQSALALLFPKLNIHKNLNNDVEKQVLQYIPLNTLAQLQVTSKALREHKAINDQMQNEARAWFEQYMPTLAKKIIASNEQDWITKRKAIHFALTPANRHYNLIKSAFFRPKADEFNLPWLPGILGKDPFAFIDTNTLNKSLVDAAKQNDTEEMIYLIITGVSPWGKLNSRRFVSRKESPLHSAAEYGHLNAVSLLLELGVYSRLINCPDGMTVFDVAAYNGHVDLMKFLNGKPGCSPVYKNDYAGEPPIFLAASNGKLAAVDYLLKQGARINEKDDCNRTILHWAAAQPEMIKFLLERGALPNINVKNIDGYTPLHRAVLEDNVASVKALLKAGANINIKDRDGKIPLSYAANPQILKLLKLAPLTEELKAKANELSFNLFKICLDTTIKSEKKEIFKELNKKIQKKSDKHSGQTVNAVIDKFLDTNKKSKLHEHRNFFFSKERPAEEKTRSEDFIDDIKSKYGSLTL